MPREQHVSRLLPCLNLDSSDVSNFCFYIGCIWRVDQREVDFIQKWIFPGGFLPSVSFVAEAVQKGGHNRLIIDSVSNIGVSHAMCVKCDQADSSHTTPEHYENGDDVSYKTSIVSTLRSLQNTQKWQRRISRYSSVNGFVSFPFPVQRSNVANKQTTSVTVRLDSQRGSLGITSLLWCEREIRNMEVWYTSRWDIMIWDTTGNLLD